jgi:hypothetical protein
VLKGVSRAGSMNLSCAVAHGLGSSAPRGLRFIRIGDGITLFSGSTFLYDNGDLKWIKGLYVTPAAII